MLKTEKQAPGKYEVYTTGDYPRRVGFIVGAKDTWLAESGSTSLGYHKTKISALESIAAYCDDDSQKETVQ